ncbi:tetraspanin-14-like isoform X2 [Brienomyrus brachyistius]|uniref:tetraspanin-14-like isoform X2 n=1 Tax=Brienomyrus brachyistius TaxID=42636 RepID=UPI0020B38DFA|nr:tetraspanin-14-like isoform X2 [Brienomyrus brachyistius]
MQYYRYKTAEVSCFYKYLMFSYNVVFWLAGAAFIAIGIWAWSEKFSTLIGFIFFLELTAAVLAFVFQDTLREWIRDLFLSNIKAYRDDIDLQNLIDSLQKLNHCCGASGPDDWNENLYFNCGKDNPSRERCGVPFSCCVHDPANPVVNTQCGYGIRDSDGDHSEFINVKGCVAAMEAWLPRNIYIVAGVFIVISLLQMVGIYLSRTLIGDIERVKFNM